METQATFAERLVERQMLSSEEMERVRKLAAYLDQKVTEHAGQIGQVGDARLLVLAALTLADELADAYDELALLRERPGPVPEIPPPGQARANGAAEEKIAASLDALAERIEALAARIEAA